MFINSIKIKNDILDNDYGIKTSNKNEIAYGVPQKSFPIEWGGVPERTKSFAIVLEDFDNIQDEGVHWVHWIVVDINPSCRQLAEDCSRVDKDLVQGHTSWTLLYGPYENIPEDVTCRYGGPAPERRHEYELTLYALDCKLGLKPGFYYNQLRRQMEGKILESVTLKFYYG